MARVAQDLAVGGENRGRGVGLERMAKRIVDGDEEPGVAAALHHRARQRVGEAHRRRTPRRLSLGVQFFPVNARRPDRAGDGDAILLQRDLLDGECDR